MKLTVRKAMFFRNKKRFAINEGDRFKRTIGANIEERAIVEWVGRDAAGIPHVRYRSIAPGLHHKEEMRLLAKEVFIDNYAPV